MLQLEQRSSELLDIEISIINSNPFFNLISKNKEALSKEEILEEIKEATDLGAERFFIKDGQQYIGVLEYLLRNPGDECTWLGLLLIDKKHQSKGYGYQALQLFYGLMQDQGIGKFRIGVIAENEPAHQFWQKNGFQYVRTTSNSNQEGKEVVVYEKCLGASAE